MIALGFRGFFPEGDHGLDPRPDYGHAPQILNLDGFNAALLKNLETLLSKGKISAGWR